MPDPRWQRYCPGVYHLPGDGFCALAWQADGKLAHALVNQGTTYRSGPETIVRYTAPTLEEVMTLAERRVWLEERGQQTLPEVETT